MKRLLAVALALIGCGGSGPASNTPPPPAYPNMTGGWGGTVAQVWTSPYGSGADSCNSTWLVTGQDRQSFSGTYVVSPGQTDECGSAGSLQGGVTIDGAVTVSLRSHSGSGCTLVSGDRDYSGFVSPAGGLTVTRTMVARCPSLAARYGGPSTIDYRLSVTFALSRR